MSLPHRSALALAALMLTLSAPTQATIVFETDFESGIPPQIDPGTARLTPSRGYKGLGIPGNYFKGKMLRSWGDNVVTLRLDGLPLHHRIYIDFLFAAIDSLDGSGDTFPNGDYFNVKVDGVSIFRESFANATPDQEQSYVPWHPSLELARRVDLGFNGPGGFYTDSAYALGREPRMNVIKHGAPSVVITFQMEGPGVQGKADESWAIDNLQIKTSKHPYWGWIPR